LYQTQFISNDLVYQFDTHSIMLAITALVVHHKAAASSQIGLTTKVFSSFLTSTLFE
jgi:hypothetical protein